MEIAEFTVSKAALENPRTETSDGVERALLGSPPSWLLGSLGSSCCVGLSLPISRPQDPHLQSEGPC